MRLDAFTSRRATRWIQVLREELAAGGCLTRADATPLPEIRAPLRFGG